MSLINRIRASSLLWKLIFINVLVIGLAIALAGVSVKDFACLLVEQYPFVGEQQSQHFNHTMQVYLFKASSIAVLIASLVHYIFVKKTLKPLSELSVSVRDMAEGHDLDPLPITSYDEIGQLTADFNHLQTRLKQTEQLRQKMVTDVAHELRTPLTNINGYLEALGAGVIEGSRETYHSLHEESLRITRLVEQLHELNVWQGRQLVQKEIESLSMQQLLHASIQSFSLAFENKQISVTDEIMDSQPQANKDGLKQVMMNLFQNVLRYDEGGWVHIKGEVEKGQYRVSVSNLGQSTDEMDAVTVFQRFYRPDPSRSRESGGAGLGLSLVKEIIEQHGGEVGVTFDEGVHSFWFTIPV